MSIIKAAGAGEVSTGFFDYELNQSLRFNDGDSPYLNFTPSSASNQKTWTYSLWVKRTTLGARQALLSAGTGGGLVMEFRFGNSDQLEYLDSSSTYLFITSQKFRDPAAWYHLVLRVDTTESNANERTRLYVNGEQITSFSTDNRSNHTLNEDLAVNTTTAHYISRWVTGGEILDGYLAEVNFVDGVSLGPTNFGETKDGVWIPKAYSGSYGTNGWYLPFDDSSAIGDDESGNTNDWTANNLAASDVVKDSPTNSFCTLNPLTAGTYPTLNEANLSIATVYSADLCGVTSTWYPTTGKWYWEVHLEGNTATYPIVGITDQRYTMTNATTGSYYSLAWRRGTGVDIGSASYMGTKTVRNADSTTNNDINMFALDVDARKIWIGKNGTWNSDGDPAAGANPDGSWTLDTGVSPSFMGYNGQGVATVFNFGQDGTFNGNQTAQGNSDGNGVGDFYYSPPTGFLAMATNNIDTTIGPGQDTQADDNFETMLYTGSGAGQSIGAGGVQHPQDTITIANSLNFNNADSSFLSYQPGANGDTKKMTYSGWIKLSNLSYYHILLQSVDSTYDSIWIQNTSAGNKLQVILGSTSTAIVASTRKLTNTSKWYHICVNIDTTQATASNRIKVWIDGVQETLTGTQPSQNAVFAAWFKSGVTTRMNFDGGSTYGNGYIAEVHVAEGTTYDYTYFGQVGSNGYWIPKTVSSITYGDEGFHLDFADSSALGDDESGNTNDFTATNLDATNHSIDSPTQNFATIDPNTYGVISSSAATSEGNTAVTVAGFSSTLWGGGFSTFEVPYGFKAYVEVRANANGSNWGAGVCLKDSTPSSTNTGGSGSVTYYNRSVMKNGVEHQYHSDDGLGGNGDGTNPLASGDILSIAVDGSTGDVWFADNGTYFKPIFSHNTSGDIGSSAGDPAAGTGATGTVDRGDDPKAPLQIVFFGGSSTVVQANFGANPNFNDSGFTTGTESDDNSVGLFKYNPPTGFLALMNDNIPQEGIASPDWLWIKERSSTSGHFFFDTVRGVHKYVQAQGTATEVTDTTQVQSFDNQGFTVGSSTGINQNGVTNVAWTWKAGGTAVSNTDGSITSSVSANQDAGFSIVSYTGTGANATIGHGLSSAPESIFIKARTRNENWLWYHKFDGGTDGRSFLNLNTTGAKFDNGPGSYFQDTPPTASVFYQNNSSYNVNTDTYIAYCFHSVEGYCKIGKFLGNSNSNGQFVHLGFRPAWVLIKSTSSGTNSCIFDSKRLGFNVDNNLLRIASATEQTDDDVDFLSNGLKFRRSSTNFNNSSHTYVYIAFAEAPFKFANAR